MNDAEMAAIHRRFGRSYFFKTRRLLLVDVVDARSNAVLICWHVGVGGSNIGIPGKRNQINVKKFRETMKSRKVRFQQQLTGYPSLH